jgi:hypothetical protein
MYAEVSITLTVSNRLIDEPEEFIEELNQEVIQSIGLGDWDLHHAHVRTLRELSDEEEWLVREPERLRIQAAG